MGEGVGLTSGAFFRIFTPNTAAMLLSALITSDPEILGGQSVFAGTRVPVESLFDYLEAGISLDEFLAEFPSVTREQVVQVLVVA
jgi:uncharacterized protein (DUF433 family)